MNVLRSSTRLLIQVQKSNCLSVTARRGFERWMRPAYIEISSRKKALENPPPKDPPKSGFLEWNYEAEIYAFNHRLKEKFDLELLSQALTHHSYILKEEQRQRSVGIEEPILNIGHNRQLVEDGKILTSNTIKTWLGLALPRTPHECIMALHDHLMTGEVVANSSRCIGTKDIILSEEYPPTEETLANTFFALVAALAQSVDETHAGIFVRDFLIAVLGDRDLKELWCPENPLEILDNILVKDGQEPAEPRIIRQSGATTVVPVYHIGLYTNKQFISSGTESTIEDAVKIAALNALYKFFDFADSSQPMKFNFHVDLSKDIAKNIPLNEWCVNNVSKLMQKY